MKKIILLNISLLMLITFLTATSALAAKFDIHYFTSEARYTGVVFQQGRVQLDQDFNEDVELEIRARDQGLADEIFAKEISDDHCKWLSIGTLKNSGKWEKNIFHLSWNLYPAVEEGLRIKIDINADTETPTFLEYSKLSVVPVPGTLLLLTSGLTGVIWGFWVRKRANLF